MSQPGGALDSPPKKNDTNDNSKDGRAPKSDNPLLIEANESGARIINVLDSLNNLCESLTTPLTIDGVDNKSGSKLQPAQNPNSKSDKANPIDNYQTEKYSGRSSNNNSDTQQERKSFHWVRPAVINLEGLMDSVAESVSPRSANNLQDAKERFLKSFKKNGGDSDKAKYYLDNMIKIHHDKAEYARQHPKEKVYYASDRSLAACINELSKVPGARRTGTAAQFSNEEINGKLLRLVGAIGLPEKNINQGQIGSCALHAAIGYIVEIDPKHVARVGSQILRTGEYRGAFNRQDMSGLSGQNDVEHMLGVAMRRNVYKGQHLDENYGGTDAKNLAAGIKRMTWGEVHAVWNDENTVSNGADLDITMDDSHCQRTICRVFREGGQLVMKEKTDNTWKGFMDGTWKVTHGKFR